MTKIQIIIISLGILIASCIVCNASILNGNPLTEGNVIVPTGETIYWKWFGASLGMIDSNQQCVWNEGEPRTCTLTELSILLTYFKI